MNINSFVPWKQVFWFLNFLLYLQLRIYTLVGITITVVTKVKAYEPQPADTTVEDIMIWKSVIDLVLPESTRKKKIR